MGEVTAWETIEEDWFRNKIRGQDQFALWCDTPQMEGSKEMEVREEEES